MISDRLREAFLILHLNQVLTEREGHGKVCEGRAVLVEGTVSISLGMSGICKEQQESLCVWSTVSRRETRRGGCSGGACSLVGCGELIGLYSDVVKKTLEALNRE